MSDHNKDEWDNKFSNNIVFGRVKYYHPDDDDNNNRLDKEEKELLRKSFKEERSKYEEPDLLGEASGQQTFEWPLQTRA